MPSPNAVAIIRSATRQSAHALVSKPAKSAGTQRVQIDELLTPREVQRALKVSESWLKRSDIRFIKIGRLRRYIREDVDAYLAARLVGA